MKPQIMKRRNQMVHVIKKMPLPVTILVAVAMMIIMWAVPQEVHADTTIEKLWVGNSEEVTSDGVISGTGATKGRATVSVASDGIVLTLDNFEYAGQGHAFTIHDAGATAAIYYAGSEKLTIELIGDNLIKGTAPDTAGIKIGLKDLIVTGPGSLKVISGPGQNNWSQGIVGGDADNYPVTLTVENCKLEVIAKDSVLMSTGIYGFNNLDVKDKGDLTVSSGKGL